MHTQENQEYIDSILEDVRWIQSDTESFQVKSEPDTKKHEDSGPWFGPVYKTSDRFEVIYQCAKELIKSGDAYVDSLSAEEMREYRGSLTEGGKNSPYRERSIEENLDLFERVREVVPISCKSYRRSHYSIHHSRCEKVNSRMVNM